MEFNQHNLQQLIHEKLAGIISREDEAYLDALVAGNEAIRDEWERQKSKYAASDIREHFARFDDPAEWQKVNDTVLHLERTFRKRRYLFMIKAAAAAAILAGIVFTANKVFNTQQAAPSNYRPVTIKKEAVQLQLANGRSVDLSAGRSDTIMALSGAQITTHGNKSLSYKVTGETVAAGMNTLTVPAGLNYKIQLADGTEVWMNSATSLKFPSSFTGENREITLNGEAYLNVAKDVHKPFMVHLPGSTIQVLGTEFNINTYDPATVRVALVKGNVQMIAAGERVAIKPGEEAVFLPGKGTHLQPFDAEDVLSWRKGLYYFYNATLADVCTVLPRWFGITVKMDEPDMSGKSIAGMIDRNKPIKDFLENLKASSKINYYFDADSTLHFKSR